MAKVIEMILEKLQEGAETTVDLLDIMFTDRSTSYRRARRGLHYTPSPKFKFDWSEWYRKRQAFYSLLNKLKREGLIVRGSNRRGAPWEITKKGLHRFGTYRSRIRSPGGILMKTYPQEKSSSLVIVSYDIPEKERKKRDWLRANLISFDLNLLQKSVWAGFTRIPTAFLKELKKHNLLSCVHIFSVDKSGTIEKIINS